VKAVIATYRNFFLPSIAAAEASCQYANTSYLTMQSLAGGCGYHRCDGSQKIICGGSQKIIGFFVWRNLALA
jgi:hypothetical protein